jgi:hypothetical protein
MPGVREVVNAWLGAAPAATTRTGATVRSLPIGKAVVSSAVARRHGRATVEIEYFMYGRLSTDCCF